MLEAKLLDLDPKAGKFHTTSKGLEFLKYFEDVAAVENSVIEKRRVLSKMLTDKDAQIC